MNITSDPLASARTVLKHANRRLDEFRTLLVGWVDKSPYACVKQFDPDPAGPYDIHKIKQVVPVPDELIGVAFDIVNSLRSSLDHVCYAVAHRSVSGKVKNAHFPFADSLAGIDARANGRSKDIPKNVFDFIKNGFKPYLGGNDLLWGMNRICNTQKHDFIAPMAGIAAVGAMNLGSLYFAKGDKGGVFPPVWDRSENEAVICIAPFGAPVSYSLQISALITLTEPEVLRDQHALAVFEQMTRMVEGIISGIEAESRRLGIFI